MNERPGIGDIASEVGLPRILRLAPTDIELRLRTRRQRVAATAERARALNERVFQHRVTGEIRAASWQPNGVLFLDPKSGRETLRPHHKALSWCSNADDITPADATAPGGIR